jgi:hypothetical protein
MRIKGLFQISQNQRGEEIAVRLTIFISIAYISEQSQTTKGDAEMGRTLKCGARSAPAGGKGMNNFRQRKNQEHCICARKDASIERYGGFEQT